MKNKSTFLISLSLLVSLIFNPWGTNIFELAKIQFLGAFLGLAMISFVVFFLYKGKIKLVHNNYLSIFFSLWLISLVLSTTFSISPELSFFGSYSRMQGLYSHFIYLSFFIIFLNLLKTKKSQQTFLKVMIFIASISAVIAIFEQFGISFFPKREIALNEFMGRSFALMGHPNSLGQFLLFPVWASIYFFYKAKKKKSIGLKSISLFAAMLLITALIFTRNRASVLGLIISIIFFLFIKIRIKTVYKILTTMIFSAGFIFFIYFFAPGFRSLSVRTLLWKNSLKLFPENPFIGSGIETFKLVFQKVSTPEFFGLEDLYSIADRAHNEYLDILITQGAFGLIIYLSIIAILFYLLYKKRKNLHENTLLLTSICAFISILVTNFFSFSLTVHYLILMALIAIILNSLIKLKSISYSKNLKTVFISGIVIVLSLSLIINSIKIVYADINLKTGITKIYSGETKQGIEDMFIAAKNNIHQADIYYYISGTLYSVASENSNHELAEKALSVLDIAGQYSQNDFYYYLSKAKIHILLENYTLAKKALETASDLSPVHPAVLKEWGNFYYQMEEYKKAIDQYEYLLSLLPDYWKWKNSLHEHDLYEQEKYRLFIKNTPDFWEIFDPLSESYQKTNNQEKADYYFSFGTSCCSL